MRILFFGDLAPTGFGTVTMDLGRELLKIGHDLRFVSQNEIAVHHADNCGEAHGFPCNCNPSLDLPEPFGSRTWQVNDPSMFVPELRDRAGATDGLGKTALALASHGYQGFFNGRLWADAWQPEIAVILGDPGNVRLMVMRDEVTRAAFAVLPVYHYVPIEGIDLPQTLREMWSIVHPIAMSEFGATEIERLTGKRPPMVYHGVDTDVFHPISPERMLVITRMKGTVAHIDKLRSKADCRKLLGVDPGGRWILRTDRNMPRKRYPELFRSLAPVLAERPDVKFIVHCSMGDQGGNLEDWLSKYPPRIRSQIIVTDAGGRLSRDWLLALYNAADVYVSNSAEGFGLTIAEAMACGVPAVGLDYSAVTEVIGPGGVVTKPAGLVDNEYGYFWAAADQRAFGDAVGSLLDDEPRRKALGRAAAEHVKTSFRWDRAAVQFTEILAPLEAVA